jgi:pyroglutamyl-peptidase
MASKKVLLTGFEPFNGGSFNPSGAVVEAISKDGVGGVEIVTAILPVEFKRSAAMLLELISSNKPDVVISLGQAEGRDFIAPEQVAINLADARIADNAGVKLENQLLNDAAADGYFSTLPIRSIVEAISSLGINVKISYSAGAFICNEIFFATQSFLKGSTTISGFIHLPLAPVQAADFPGLPTMAIEDQVRAIKEAIKVSINV